MKWRENLGFCQILIKLFISKKKKRKNSESELNAMFRSKLMTYQHLVLYLCDWAVKKMQFYSFLLE